MADNNLPQKSIRGYLATRQPGTFLMIANLPFIFFLGFLATIYIANAHYAEKKVREIQQLQTELKKERWRYMSLKSDLMFNSKQMEISRMVAPYGLKELQTKPKKIVVSAKKKY